MRLGVNVPGLREGEGGIGNEDSCEGFTMQRVAISVQDDDIE